LQFIFLSFEDETKFLNVAKTNSVRHRNLNLCASVPSSAHSSRGRARTAASRHKPDSSVSTTATSSQERTIVQSVSRKVNLKLSKEQSGRNQLRKVLQFYRNPANVKTMVERHLPHVKVPVQTGF